MEGLHISLSRATTLKDFIIYIYVNYKLNKITNFKNHNLNKFISNQKNGGRKIYRYIMFIN